MCAFIVASQYPEALIHIILPSDYNGFAYRRYSNYQFGLIQGNEIFENFSSGYYADCIEIVQTYFACMRGQVEIISKSLEGRVFTGN